MGVDAGAGVHKSEADLGSVTDRSIGRVAELAEACREVDEALAGRGHPLLVVGEPGMGKTLMVEDVGRYAKAEGMHVVMTRCPNGEGTPPYWPWSELLRSCLRQCDPDVVARQPDLVRADVGRLLPEVSVDEARPGGLPDDDRSRFEFFHGVSALLHEAAREVPQLVMLDDLHWADTPTLKLFQFLARSLVGLPLLLVGTYRDVEVGSGHPLAEVIDGLPSETLRIELRGVTGSDIGRLVAETAGFDPPSSLVRWVQGHTGGNPLFVKEVVRLLKFERRLHEPPGDLVLPAGVRGIIERRLGGLASDTVEVLRWGAVCGHEFGVAILERASRLSSDEVSRALRTAQRARLVALDAERPGRCGFTHGLVFETLRDGMLPSDRSSRHLRVAQVHMEGEGDSGSAVSEISYHLLAGLPQGDPNVAADYAVRAAEEASRRLAWEEAARLYGEALDALGPGGDSLGRAKLMVERAAALGLAGDRPASRDAALEAAEAARRAGASEVLARAALVFAASPFAGLLPGGDARTVELFEDILDGLGPADSAIRAILLARLAREHYFVDPSRFMRLGAEALVVAGRVGDPTAIWEALFQRHFALTGTTDLGERLATSSEMMRVGEQTKDWERRLVARVWHVIDLAVAGDGPAFNHEIKAFAGAVDLAGLRSFRWYVALWEGAKAMAEGRLVDAEDRAREALDLAGPRGQHAYDYFGIQLSGIRDLQNRAAEVESILTEAADRIPAIPAWRCALAFNQIRQGHTATATALVEGLAVDGFAVIPRDVNWLAALNLLAETCVELKNSDWAQVIYSLLAPYAKHHVVVGLGAMYLGPVARLLGRLAALRRDWELADEHFRAALTAAQRFGAPLWVAQTKLDWATLLTARGRAGDREVAHRLLDDVRAFAHRMDVPRLRRQLDDASAGPSAEVASSHQIANTFRKEGDYWTIAYQGVCVRLRDLKGLHDIAEFLALPDRAIHVLELHAASGDARWHAGGDPVIDARARNEYRQRLVDLESEIEEAELLGDSGRATRARDEREALAGYLAGVYGLGGRIRRVGDTTEQARKAVWHRLSTSFKVIDQKHPALSRHLRRSIRTGTFCTYSPEEPVDWSF